MSFRKGEYFAHRLDLRRADAWVSNSQYPLSGTTIDYEVVDPDARSNSHL